MWHPRAIQKMLVEEVAGLGRSAGDPATAVTTLLRQELAAASRRAKSVIALDWIALAVLVTARLAGGDGGDELANVVFAVAPLLIAAHSGFRLGQLEKYRAVSRTLEEIEERSA